MIIKEVDLDFFKKYENYFSEGYIILDPNRLLKEISSGDHRYFIAMIDNEVAGFSAMVRYFHVNEVRVYHRAAFVFPKFRKSGVWIALMNYKIEYMKENNWCDLRTINAVSVSESDLRYERLGWTRHDRKIQKVGDLEIPRITWYTRWENLKNNV
jgi:GNAT superfamily N-acetyltransferase